MGDLSPHFSSREFACHHCGQVKVAPTLVARLELLRAEVGRPLRIVSGYRCPVHNRAVGGAKLSKHVLGEAADIPSGYATIAQAEKAGFRGIGNRGRWAVHVDVRRSPARWRY